MDSNLEHFDSNSASGHAGGLLTKDPSSYIVNPYHNLNHACTKKDGNYPVIRIGKMCSIAYNCTFITSQHHINRFTTARGGGTFSKGDLIIKNDVWIGANCTILDGITIGNGAVVGAGSIVTKDVPPYAVVCGNPARIIKYRFTPDIISRIERLNVWNLPTEIIKTFDIYSEDIEKTVIQMENFFSTNNAYGSDFTTSGSS